MSHAGYIVGAYAATFAIVGVAIAVILRRHRALKAALARLERTSA